MQKLYPRLFLKPQKERSILNQHPWLFSGAVAHGDESIREGEIVEIYSADKKYLATGHYHEGSIKTRIFSFEETACDYEFWKKKLAAAIALRQLLGYPSADTNAFRLVNAEGDGLPGLIIDIYNKTAVIQAHTKGMYQLRSVFCEALLELLPGIITTVYDKSFETSGENDEGGNSFLAGNEKHASILEHGIRFEVDVESGQKTGFFLDQRENRKLLAAYANGKNVLNTFAYSGGFSLYALKANAGLVHSVDSSKKAAELCEKNVASNFTAANHAFFTEDVFDFLKKSSGQYDVMVLDPPAFAKHLSAVAKATVGYRNLNAEAMKRISSKGILFTFSCSQVIDKNLFRKIIFTSAIQARRNVKVLHQLTQPADHPVSIYHPEGDYLKGLVLYVE